MHKSPLKMNLDDRKIDLTLRLYVDPADEDYVAARHAYSNGLFHVFYWCAAQACEKYMKSFLLLQDQSVQNYGHDLTALFRDVTVHDKHKIIPQDLHFPKTSAMGREAWEGKPTSSYIEYLSQYGSADNRYAFYGTFVNGPVLHALDLICNAFRRALNSTMLSADLFASQAENLPFHEKIHSKEDWMIDPTLLLERLFSQSYQVGQGAALRAAFSKMNRAFFHEISTDERSFGGQNFHGSPLYNHLVRLAEIYPTEQNKETITHLREWASSHIFLSSAVRNELKLPRTPRRDKGTEPDGGSAVAPTPKQ